MKYFSEMKLIVFLFLIFALLSFAIIGRARYVTNACATVCSSKKYIATVDLGIPWTCECRLKR